MGNWRCRMVSNTSTMKSRESPRVMKTMRDARSAGGHSVSSNGG